MPPPVEEEEEEEGEEGLFKANAVNEEDLEAGSARGGEVWGAGGGHMHREKERERATTTRQTAKHTFRDLFLGGLKRIIFLIPFPDLK